eukprot:jgi/Hompol1/2994/HPOL_006284-RA
MSFATSNSFDDLANQDSQIPLIKPKATNIVWHEGIISREERIRFAGQQSTIAAALEQFLLSRGLKAYRLDGDNIRFGLNKDLGFSAADRKENIRRISE